MSTLRGALVVRDYSETTGLDQLSIPFSSLEQLNQLLFSDENKGRIYGLVFEKEADSGRSETLSLSFEFRGAVNKTL